MTKYIIAFLSTSLFLSLILYVSEVECKKQLQESDRISMEMIGLMSDKLQELE